MKTLLNTLKPIAFVLILILAPNATNAMFNGGEDPNGGTDPKAPVATPSSAVLPDTAESIAAQIRKFSLWSLPKALETKVHKLLRSPEDSEDKKDTLIYLYASLFAELKNHFKAIDCDLSDGDMGEIRELVFSQSKVELEQLAANEDLRKAGIQVDLLHIVKSETLKDYILVYWVLKNTSPESETLDLTSLEARTQNKCYLPINSLLRLPPLAPFTKLTSLTLCLPPLPLENDLTREQVDQLETVVIPLATLENHEALLKLPKLENLHLEQTRRVSFPDYKRSSSMTALNLESTQRQQILDPHKIIPALLERNVGIIWKVSFVGKGQ